MEPVGARFSVTADEIEAGDYFYVKGRWQLVTEKRNGRRPAVVCEGVLLKLDPVTLCSIVRPGQ